MKKYIKTKDGIYEVSHTDVCWRYAVGSGEIVDKSEVYVCKNGDKIPFNQVLAEADTPEELQEIEAKQEMKKKYIRTKDGIYEVIREILDGKGYEVKVPQSKWDYDEDNKCYYEDSKIDGFNKNEIIAQADTPEELCDGFYLDDGQEEFCLDDVFTNFGKFKYSYMYNNKYHIMKYEGYGFIKTSKGLIYVGKMNDDGDLKLI